MSNLNDTTLQGDSTLTFFRPDTVLKDIKRFVDQIHFGYKVDNCSLYQEEASDRTVWIGYEIKKDNQQFIVKMLYEKNESGQLAIKVKSHVLVIDGLESPSGFATLGEVFSLVGITKLEK
jgi:hypothetical protein